MNVRARALTMAVVFSCWSAVSAAGEPLARSGAPAPSMIRLSRAVAFAFAPSPEKPGIVYLHGICGRAENGCPHFASGASAWLLCPRAPLRCAAGGDSWGVPGEAAETVHHAEEELAAALPERDRVVRPGILVGFSQGGYVARDIYGRRPHAFRGVMVLGANVRFARADLERAGVRRVALGAGRFDATYEPLRGAAAALEKEGFPVRFVDLGAVGHTYVSDAARATAIPDALAWLADGDAGG